MKFECPICQQSLEADEDMAGASVQCPNCGRYIPVPGSPPGPPPPIAKTEDATARHAPPPAAAVAGGAPMRVRRMPPGAPTRVVISDISVPFASIFSTVLKVVIALFLIGALVYAVFLLLFLGGCAALFHGAMMGAGMR